MQYNRSKFCRSNKLREFMLYSTRSSIYRYEFGNKKTTRIVSGYKHINGIDYDYNENCLYWADSELDSIHVI